MSHQCYTSVLVWAEIQLSAVTESPITSLYTPLPPLLSLSSLHIAWTPSNQEGTILFFFIHALMSATPPPPLPPHTPRIPKYLQFLLLPANCGLPTTLTQVTNPRSLMSKPATVGYQPRMRNITQVKLTTDIARQNRKHVNGLCRNVNSFTQSRGRSLCRRGKRSEIVRTF